MEDGVFNLIKAAADKKEAPSEFDFLLDGDLCQMSAQKEFLIDNGIEIRQQNVYPAIKNIDVGKSLTIIYQYCIPGWWNYLEHYLKYKICTKEEYNEKLDKQIKREKCHE